MTDLQYTLTAPDHCKGEGCDCRLSVADLGGLCVNCQYALEQAAKKQAERRGVNGQKLPSQYVKSRDHCPERAICKCGRGPVNRDNRCAACGRENMQRVRARQKSQTHPDELARWQASNEKRRTNNGLMRPSSPAGR
jgi:hypothetical protein